MEWISVKDRLPSLDEKVLISHVPKPHEVMCGECNCLLGEIVQLKQFGLSIKEKRRSLGITQLKLAELADSSIQHIGNLERGEANPSILMVYKIAEALNVNVKELFIKNDI
jgi:DNA-binding XRE family transcriptional regulator